MSMMIYSKDNNSTLHRVITKKLLITVQSDTEACAIIEKVDDITPSILEEMSNLVGGNVVKIVGAKSDFEKLESTLKLVFDDYKFVSRENNFEIFFQASPPVIKAAKSSNSNLSTNKKAKVLIVDDSKTICNLLSKIMDLSPEIEVVGIVNDPFDAEKSIEELKPDVITLDIHMPGMNGVELLKKINPKYSIPCIMISSISIKEGPLVLDALDNGAVDYIQKPDMSNFANVAAEINATILAASKVVARKEKKSPSKVISSVGLELDNTLMVIGASTGGTKALQNILKDLPASIPPTLIVQHIPAEFSKAFADRLNEYTKFEVRQAVDGDELLPNLVLVAPGGFQMKYIQRGEKMFVEINDDEPVNRFKPSVDYLFNSVADSKTKKHIVSAIFTGMGKDGAKGMKRLKEEKAAVTIAQDEESSVVFGMPKEAIALGCVDKIVSLDDAAACLIEQASNNAA